MLFVKNKIYKVIFFEIKLRILKRCIVIDISVIFMSLIRGNHGGMFLDALSIEIKLVKSECMSKLFIVNSTSNTSLASLDESV